jgi:integrase
VFDSETGSRPQGRRLLDSAAPSTPRDLRDHAMVAMVIGCGLRRAELLGLTLDSIQQREEHWVIADLVGQFFARPRLHPDERALPRVQAEASNCRERPVGNRTRRGLTPTTARADAQSALGHLWRLRNARPGVVAVLSAQFNGHQGGPHDQRRGLRPVVSAKRDRARIAHEPP